MKYIFCCLVFCYLLLPCRASALKALYNSLEPTSVSRLLALYELYPDSEEGKKALNQVCRLLRCAHEEAASLYPFINRLTNGSEELSYKEILLIESLARHLPNRKLKGYRATSEKEVLQLPSEEIDLGVAFLLSQLDGEKDAEFKARSYSARLDLMALQILASLPEGAGIQEKIKATNAFIFDQMHFRFPPQSIYAENIDLYTFLPSVMDNHLGVCLGVTALYLAIAQRIDLPLEIITPPGHIYIRHREGERVINIETTARGIDVDTERYLSVNTYRLEERVLKEVIGMMHVNQASTYLHTENYEKAQQAYEKALLYLPDDPLVKELLGYCYLFLGKEERGEALLKEMEDVGIEGEIAKNSTLKDYLANKVDLEGIKAVFMLVDESYESIQKKKNRLEKVLQKYPHFREGLLQLAVCWVQLNRAKEALRVLQKYHSIYPHNPVIEYYLAILHGERHDFKSCWHYLKNAEAIVAAYQFSPKALKELRRVLTQHCPERLFSK